MLATPTRRVSADALGPLLEPVETEDTVLASDQARTIRSMLQPLPPSQARIAGSECDGGAVIAVHQSFHRRRVSAAHLMQQLSV
jgi:hypothetical protein